MDKSRRVLVIEAISGGAALVSAAAKLGLEVVVASADRGDRSVPRALRSSIGELIVVETNDLEQLSTKVCEAHARQPIDAIFAGCDVYVPAAAHIAARLGLVGLDPATVDRVRDKVSMREAVAAAGLAEPRFREVIARDALVSAGDHVGFPCVMKPADQSGSLHVSRADDAEQLLAAYDELLADPLIDLGRPLGGRVLVEEYLPGVEVSVEGYVLNDVVTIVSVTDKVLGPEPHFAELGHVVPSAVDTEVRQGIERYVALVVRAVAITIGPFHCEVRLTPGGPVLVEIGARLPGDRIPELVELACGVSLARVWLAAHLDVHPATLGAFGKPVTAVSAVKFFTAGQEAVFRGIAGVDEALALSGVREIVIDAQPGDALYGLVDFRCRLGHALLALGSRDELAAVAACLDELIQINPDGARGASARAANGVST